MLTPKQKQQLKGLANPLDSMYQIGKKEISNSQIEMLDKALTAHELIKISLLKTVNAPQMEIALDLSSALHCDVVQIIGRVVVLYRANPEKPNHIRLVK